MSRALILCVSLAVIGLVNAIQIQTPQNGSSWNVLGGPRKISWTSVSTDPSQFDIWLTQYNAGGAAPSPQKIAENVTTSLGSYTFDGQLPSGPDFRFQFTSYASYNEIYAESQDFSISSTTGTGAPTGASVTATTSATGSSTGTSTGTATAASGAEKAIGRIGGEWGIALVAGMAIVGFLVA